MAGREAVDGSLPRARAPSARGSQARRASRPLVPLALSILAGAWLGAASRPEGWMLAAAVAAWLGAAAALTFGVRDAEPAELARAKGMVTLGLVATLAATLSALDPRMRRETDASAVAAPNLGEPLGLSPRRPLFEGRWEPVRGTVRGVLGQLVSERAPAVWIELPQGSAARGEQLRIRPIDAPRREARGPVEPPRAPFERAGLELWSARADEIERVASAGLWQRGTGWVAGLRGEVARRCERFGEGRPRALAHALLYGETEHLDPALADTFAHTGMRHVLAVSGMHVSLLAAVLLAPFLGGGRRQRALLVLVVGVGLGLFAAITGGNAPVRRAAVALAISMAAPLCERKGGAPRRVDTLSLLALGLILEAALDLRALFSVSLLLSYLATLGLVLLTRPLSRALDVVPAPVELGPTSAKKALHTALVRSLRAGIAASLAAVAVTLPLCWSTFGEWAPIGALVTALTTPLVAWLLVVGWLGVLAPAFVPAEAFDTAAHAFVRLLELADQTPWTPCVLPPRPLVLLGLATALCVGGALRAGLASRALRLGLALWAVLLVPWSLRPRGWRLDLLDVGHGTCAVLRGPTGPTWIFDAGSRDRARVGSAALGPLLAAEETARVAVVLSHSDADHSEALAWLCDRYTPERWLGAQPAPARGRAVAPEAGLDLSGAASGLRFPSDVAGDWSLLRGLERADNEGSRTLLADLGTARIVLHGDAVEDGLAVLLERAEMNQGCDLLLWPHHGDASEWTSKLLARSAPREVWISSSGAAPVERELTRRGVPWRSTGREGPLRREWP